MREGLQKEWYKYESHENHVTIFLHSREKRLLIGGDNFGRDLVGVQNLQKKHQRVEMELAGHEAQFQVRFSWVM